MQGLSSADDRGQALDHLVVPEDSMESCAPLLGELPPSMIPQTTNRRTCSSLAAACDPSNPNDLLLG